MDSTSKLKYKAFYGGGATEMLRQRVVAGEALPWIASGRLPVTSAAGLIPPCAQGALSTVTTQP